MNQSKGFSLIEVLLSLMLTTTLVFFLLELQGNARLYFKQTLFRTQDLSFRDQADEERLLRVTS
jgi:Tfp pilus assembly protein PilV